MNGTHRNDGIFIATGQGESLQRAREMAPKSLVGVAAENRPGDGALLETRTHDRGRPSSQLQ